MSEVMSVKAFPMSAFTPICEAAGIDPSDVYRITLDVRSGVDFFVHRRNEAGSKYLVSIGEIAIDVIHFPIAWNS